jgi:hypothetical protein
LWSCSQGADYGRCETSESLLGRGTGGTPVTRTAAPQMQDAPYGDIDPSPIYSGAYPSVIVDMAESAVSTSPLKSFRLAHRGTISFCKTTISHPASPASLGPNHFKCRTRILPVRLSQSLTQRHRRCLLHLVPSRQISHLLVPWIRPMMSLGTVFINATY